MKQQTKVKILLQGKSESFIFFQDRINEELDEIYRTHKTTKLALVVPCADSSGRMCVVINYEFEK